MKHNDDILEFLSQPENIPLVFEVERQFKPLLDHFYNLFAELVLVDLKNRLEGNKLWEKWELIQGNIRDSDASYVTVYIDLKKEYHINQKYFLRAAVQREHDSLKYGVCWSSSVPLATPLPQEVYTIENQLHGQSFKARTDWWLGQMKIPYLIRSEIFVLQLAQNKEGFIQEILDPFWSMFTMIANDLETANQSLLDLIFQTR